MVAQAVVLDLPVRRRALRRVLACGCYADAIPARGRWRWTRLPVQNGGGAVFCHEADAAELVDRGWVTVNGRRATACLEELGCPHEVRLQFDDPWPDCHA